MIQRLYAYFDGTVSLRDERFIAMDLETTGLSPHLDKIVGIAFAKESHRGYYGTNLEGFRAVLADPKVEKIFHNAVFDLSFLKAAGFEVKGRIHDTMVMAHLIDPDRDTLSLKKLSEKHLGAGCLPGRDAMYKWLEDNSLTKSDISKAPAEIITNYAAEDAVNTFALFQKFCGQLRSIKNWLKEKGLDQNPWEYYIDECCPIFSVIADMQLRGVKLDLEATATKKVELQKRLADLSERLPKNVYTARVEDIIWKAKREERLAKSKTGKIKNPPPVSFNWDSAAHLKLLFFEALGEKPQKKTFKGNPSVDADTIEYFANKYDFCKDLLEYREVKKLLNTYLDNLLTMQIGGNIHANYNITGTATGRFSSSNPNLQNIPKQGRIKELFIPRPGCRFIYADYSQLELRIAAHLSGDELLLSAYHENRDLHQITADTIGCARDLAKTVNFAIIYNASGWRIKDILGLGSPEEGDGVKDALFKKYRGLKIFLDKQVQFMLKYGIAISEFGRIRRLPDLQSDNTGVFNHALKAGFNMPIQSFGASLCKRSMINLHSRGYKIVNQVHDSITIEVPENDITKSLKDVKQIMENIYQLRVPLVVEPKILNSFEEKA